MKKILLPLFVLMSLGWSSKAQDNGTVKTYADQVTAADLKEYLSIIASDAMEGRYTGSRGQKMAAAFIANHFQEIGLTAPVNGSYYQPIDLYNSKVTAAYVKVGTATYQTLGDVAYFGTADSGGEVPLDVIFAGRATEEEIAKIDMKDKAVVVLTGKLATSMRALRALGKTLRDKGAKLVFIMSESTSDEYHTFVDGMKAFTAGGSITLVKPDASSPNKGMFLVNHVVVEKIFNTTFDKLRKAADDPKKEALKKIKPGKASYNVTLTSTSLKTENVLGYLEGSDKKNEVVVVTAHYDHIGKANGEDKVNNGADDDGSGTVSVLEIAKAFAQAKKDGHGPRRSMVFMTVVAEELGLFGSEYYVQNPVYPLANTVVDLNIDMVGRIDPEHKDKPDYVYVIGSDKLSKELHNINEKANSDNTKLALDYTYNDENHPSNLYQRSDHWNFAKNNIPIIFFFDGIHEDYHKPSDEVSKINFDLMTKRAQLVFYTAWEVANKDTRIVNDKK